MSIMPCVGLYLLREYHFTICPEAAGLLEDRQTCESMSWRRSTFSLHALIISGICCRKGNLTDTFLLLVMDLRIELLLLAGFVLWPLEAVSWRIQSLQWWVLSLSIIHLHLFIISHNSTRQFLCNSHTFLLLDSFQSILYFRFLLWMGT